MLFTCSIENAHISFGVFDGDSLVFDSQIATRRDQTVDELAMLIGGIFSMNQVAPLSIDGAIVASVVRPMTAALVKAVEKLMHVKPLMVGPGVKTGLNIKTDIPSQVGADIVANAVAAVSLVKLPLVILDFSTATTLTGINEHGELCGVLICPGVRPSLDALSAQTADLPSIALDKPKSLFGKNTIDSMAGGVIYGHAAMIDGLLDRIAEEWQTSELTVIATGGIAEKIIPNSRSSHRIQYEADLTLLGLKKIFQLNDRHKP